VVVLGFTLHFEMPSHEQLFAGSLFSGGDIDLIHINSSLHFSIENLLNVNRRQFHLIAALQLDREEERRAEQFATEVETLNKFFSCPIESQKAAVKSHLGSGSTKRTWTTR
jgi:hypothetical protein